MDTLKLAEIMKEITTEFEISDLELSMPFSEVEITNFTELLDFDWALFKNNEGVNPTEEKDENIQKAKCPKCGHEFFLD